MPQRLPKPTYFVGAIGPATSVFLWAAQNWIQLQPFWSDTMPWTLIWWVSGAFLAGLVVQDLYNPRSWLRLMWADWNRIADMSACWWDQVPGEPLRREVSAQLSYVRDLPSVEARLWGRGAPTQAQFIGSSAERAVKGAQRRLVLASVPIRAGQWGPRFGGVDSNFLVGGDSLAMVEIELRSGFRRQRFNVQLQIHPPSDQWFVRPITEDHDPFSWPTRPA